MSRTLDDHDEAVYDAAFELAEATRRFLDRYSTKTAMLLGLLDRDVVLPLLDANDRMTLARQRRIEAARNPDGTVRLTEPPASGEQEGTA